MKKLFIIASILLVGCMTTQPDMTPYEERITALEEKVNDLDTFDTGVMEILFWLHQDEMMYMYKTYKQGEIDVK